MALEAGAVLFDHWIFPRTPFTVGVEYLTQITRSENGFEQRRARRGRPRKRISFTSRLAADCYRGMLRELAANQRGPFAVPDISRRIRSISTMQVASTQIAVASVPAWLAQGEVVILISGSRVETRTVDSIGSGAVVTFEELNGVEWPVGTYIMPALSARMETELTSSRQRKGFAEFNMAFDVTPTFERYDEPAAPSSTFNSRELFLTPPRDVNPVDVRNLSDLDITDFGAGAVSFRQPIDFPTVVDRFTYESCDQASGHALYDMFVRQRGRRGSFYAPTFAYDLLPVGASSGTTLTVRSTQVASVYSGSTVFKNIAVQYLDGSWQAIAVNALSAAGDNTNLTLAEALSSGVSAGTVRRISWLLRRRFAADRLTFDWYNDRATVALPFQTLEDV